MLDILPTGAYNKGNESEESIGLTNKARSPSVFAVPRGFLFAMGSVLAAVELFVKPLADIVSHYTCCDGQNESENCVHWPHLLSMEWAGVKRQLQDIIDSDKKQFGGGRHSDEPMWRVNVIFAEMESLDILPTGAYNKDTKDRDHWPHKTKQEAPRY